MTRINTVDVAVLAQRHLVAEYKEFTQFLHLIKRRVDNKTGFIDVPKQYTLNAGHCKFFYNKGSYMETRFTQLYNEMIKRNIKVDQDGYKTRLQKIKTIYGLKHHLNRDFTPSTNDKLLNINRMITRINEKPNLYASEELNRYVDLRTQLISKVQNEK